MHYVASNITTVPGLSATMMDRRRHLAANAPGLIRDYIEVVVERGHSVGHVA